MKKSRIFKPTPYVYLKSSHYKAGLFAIVLLFVLNGIVILLYVKEIRKNDSLYLVRAEINQMLGDIQSDLAKMDLQKAHTQLTEAQRKTAVDEEKRPAPKQELAAGRAADPEVKPAAQEKQPALPDPAREIPLPLVSTGADEYTLICEKDSRLLYLFRNTGDRMSLVKSFPCLIGANNGDKQRHGDFATPVGAYFTLRFARGLPEKYGYGAFFLNYPNFLDRRASKKGSGIWLHGHTPGKTLDDIKSTQGCVVINNDHLREISSLLKPTGTPVVIVNKMQFRGKEENDALRKELLDYLNSWRTAWESKNIDRFMSFYSPEFISADGLGFNAFKRQKQKVNRAKKFIRVATAEIAILLSPEHEGNMGVIRFHQNYSSSNFKTQGHKVFYVKKGEAGWKIVGESSF